MTPPRITGPNINNPFGLRAKGVKKPTTTHRVGPQGNVKQGASTTKTTQPGTTKTTDNSTKKLSFGEITDLISTINELNSNGKNISSTPQSTPQNFSFTPIQNSNSNHYNMSQMYDNYVPSFDSSSVQDFSNRSSRTSGYKPDTASLTKYESSLNNSNLTSFELNDMSSSLGSMTENINKAMQSTEAAVTELSALKDTAQTRSEELTVASNDAEKASNDAQKEVSDSESQLNSEIKARDQQDSLLAASNEKYGKACQDLTKAEAGKSEAQTNVSNAKQDLASAQGELNTATSTLNSLQGQLSSTPKTLEDGSTNPKYEQLEKSVQEAEKKKTEAEARVKEQEAKVTEANNKLDAANTNLDNARTAKNEALKQVNEDKEGVASLKKSCEMAQKKVETQQENYDKALEAKNEAESACTEIKTELEAQNGIINDYKATTQELAELKEAQAKIEGLNQKIEAKKPEIQKQEAAQDAAVLKEMQNHVDNSPGVSYKNTPKENLMILTKDPEKYAELIKNYTPIAYTQHMGSREDLLACGYIDGGNGSLVNPHSGEVLLEVHNNYWSSIDNIQQNGMSKDSCNLKYPGAYEALERGQKQKGYTLTRSEDGSIKLKRDPAYKP